MAPTTLLDLPTELLLQIGGYLRYSYYVALCMSCRLFHSILPFPVTRPTPPNGNLSQPSLTSHREHVPNRRMYGMLDLLHIEEWPCHTRARPRQLPGRGDFFACCDCLKIRPAIVFCNDVIKGQRGKASLADTSLSRLNRFCIPCGIKDGRYELGRTRIYFGGLAGRRGVVCKGCSKFVTYAVRIARLGYICRSCRYMLR